MIRTLIIEDEKNALELLSSIVHQYCPELNLIGSAASLTEGRQLIDKLHPDLVFLDIQLGDDTGFQLLDDILYTDFKLVITTAYDQYALEGFKHEAVDYVLKPYSPKRIVSAVNRVRKYHHDEEVFKKLTSLIQPEVPRPEKGKLSIATSEGIHLLEFNDILRLKAHKAYCEILLKNDEKLLVSRSMGELEKELPEHKFFRVHSGHVVHIDHVKQISNKEGGYVLMTDGAQVPLARRRKQEFMSAIQA